MAPYTARYRTLKSQSKSSSSPPSLPSIKYALSAVIVHKGEINSGHYVSYAREGNDWFLFDDSKVVLVSEGDVLNAEAYILVYVVETV
jgi:ubiquitin carboxyl-terminal hydrolase 22/27/51